MTVSTPTDALISHFDGIWGEEGNARKDLDFWVCLSQEMATTDKPLGHNKILQYSKAKKYFLISSWKHDCWPWLSLVLIAVKGVPCRIRMAGRFQRMETNGCSDQADCFQWTDKLGWRKHVRVDWKREKPQTVQIEESNIYTHGLTTFGSAESVFRTPPLITNPCQWVHPDWSEYIDL